MTDISKSILLSLEVVCGCICKMQEIQNHRLEITRRADIMQRSRRTTGSPTSGIRKNCGYKIS